MNQLKMDAEVIACFYHLLESRALASDLAQVEKTEAPVIFTKNPARIYERSELDSLREDIINFFSNFIGTSMDKSHVIKVVKILLLKQTFYFLFDKGLPKAAIKRYGDLSFYYVFECSPSIWSMVPGQRYKMQ